MPFGLRIINDKGVDITSGAQNVIILDRFYLPGAGGTKWYDLEPGETLHIFCEGFYDEDAPGNYPQINSTSVAGNSVSWGVAGTGSVRHVIYVVKRGTA